MWLWYLVVGAAAVVSRAEGAGAGAARLVCYVESARATDSFSECTHLVYAGDARGDKLDALLKDYKKYNPRLKIILRVSENDKDLRSLLKSKHVQGFELHEAHKTLNRTKVLETVEAARSAISASGGGPLFLALPAHPELLAKYYDLRALVKKVDLMMVQTHALGQVKKMTYHPSRLSGMWDMMNTDSVVDLVIGLGVPSSKVVISLPATARQFTLVNETLSTPGSPTEEDEPKEIDQAELCRQLRSGRWTLERDQDLSAPYAFKNKTWISFEDSSSIDVKGKYARVRGLAGLALHRADRDVENPCGPTLRASLAKVLNQQSRAPRAAVLRSLEHEILSAPTHARALDALQVSPYRITQVVDSDGVIHSIREDTRTEFSCSRQGYFVHPRSCARFYRCVKFDQLSPEYTVFEFDCPAGLAFDSRYEVCVWPGSLPHSQACPGSSEIAPVPNTRFICPEHEGYYADPENCRWFFACLDHGKSPLTAYEFRCPFGLGFDAARLKCDWPWLVPACGNIARYEAEAFGFSGATLTGAAGFQGQTADAINVAAHQSLVSGASLNNLVGIQGGFLTKNDALDSNFIASQELANGHFGEHGAAQIGVGGSLAYQVDGVHSGQGNIGLVQPTQYSSGSIILDDYRYPTNEEILRHSAQKGGNGYAAQSGAYSAGQTAQSGTYSAGYTGQSDTYNAGQSGQSGTYTVSHGAQSGAYSAGQSGAYNAGHAAAHTAEANAAGQTAHFQTGYTGSYSTGQNVQTIKYKTFNYDDDSGQYVHDPSGDVAEPYKHVDSPAEPYKHVTSGYKYTGDYFDYDKYPGQTKYMEKYEGKYEDQHNGQYSGAYVDSDASYDYNEQSSNNNADSFPQKYDNFGRHQAGVYSVKPSLFQTYNGYSESNGNYISDSKAYTGSSHTLTAGAINVGLVGKTTLIDDYDYTQDVRGHSFGAGSKSYSHSSQTLHPAQVSHVSRPAVAINHYGTDAGNLDIYERNLHGSNYATTPTSSGVPTTATPFAVTTSLPTVTYKTAFVPEAPKSSVKQIFGVSQPAVTYVQPTAIAITHSTPKVQITNQGESHQYESNNFYNYNIEAKEQSGYDYSKPSIKFEDGVSYTTAAPAVSVSTYQQKDYSGKQNNYQGDYAGFDYSTRTPVHEEPFKKVVAYTTGPSVSTFSQPTPATYTPHAFSHQTIHKVESGKVDTGYEYTKSGGSFEEGNVVQYTTPQPVVSTYQPQVINHQILHKVESANVDTGYEYTKSGGSFGEGNVIHYTTPQPAVSTYQPQVISHQTVHKVDTSKVNTYDSSSGYNYEKPAVQFKEVKTVYSTPAPIVTSTYKPQTYSHQTIHKVETQNYVPVSSTPKYDISYQSTPVTVYENPIIKYTQKVTPVTYERPAQPTYQSHTISHQTIHKVENNNAYNVESGYNYNNPEDDSSLAVQGILYTTVQPSTAHDSQSLSHKTVHNVDASQVKTYTQYTDGYKYSKPAVKFEDAPKTVFEYTTAAPVVTSTYKPQSYSHQTIHKVENKYVPVSSTPAPQVAVTKYENPILKYTQKVTPVKYVQPTAAVFTQTFKPTIQQHEVKHEIIHPKFETYSDYSLGQPEIQRDYEFKGYAGTVDDSHIIKHQSYENKDYSNGKDIVFVSSSPSTLIYEDHYVEKEAPKVEYKAPEYIPPKNDYQSYSVIPIASAPVIHQSSVVHQAHTYKAPKTEFKTYSASSTTAPIVQQNFNVETFHKKQEYEAPKTYFVSSTSAPVVYQSSVVHKKQEYESPSYFTLHTSDEVQQTQKDFDYAEQYETAQKSSTHQHSFSTSHIAQPVESIHFSFPSTTSTPAYQKVEYQAPEIQVVSKSEEYLSPVVSSVAPVVTSTFKPRTYATASTTREYLPPAEPTNEYLPPSTTARPFVKSTTPAYRAKSTTTYKASEYLPPVEDSGSKVVTYENFDYTGTNVDIQENPYQFSVTHDSAPTGRKHNIVVETAKSHLLGFGTVGPDAGLVSPVTYTTAAPVVSSTYRQRVKSTTSRPAYKYSTTTEYQAPEYLPPDDTNSEVTFENFGYREELSAEDIKNNPYQDDVVSTSAPLLRKQNIVVETAKSHQLGFGTVGPDAGLVSPVSYTTSAPIVVSSTTSYSPKVSTSTYAPVEQGLYEVTPSSVPIRRTKPKVAVVTKINDFNPFLVRKLGAVCSCQSPVLTLKGKRPIYTPQEVTNFQVYEDSGRGDINDNEFGQRYSKVEIPAATVAPIVKSTFNPIIVPDDSFYRDYQEQVILDDTHEGYVSSTPVVSTTTEKIVRVRPRVKTVTVAPTYKTILLNQEVTPAAIVKTESDSNIESQAFDRYGPGGWRSRDETLQGSVDCQRAGLFRHPKQCNKFYACRWDCTKQRFTLHVFNCPVQLSFDPSIGACNWPSQGPACQGDTLLTNVL